MNNPAQTEITGSCQCGNVEYSFKNEPYFTAVCHCTECQKLSSSAFSLTMFFKNEDMKIVGELKHYDRLSESGNTVRCFFCATCGNRIYHANPNADDGTIRFKGTLDNKDFIRPRIQVWTGSKQKWLGGLSNLPAFVRQSNDRSIIIRRIILGKLWTGLKWAAWAFAWGSAVYVVYSHV